MSYLTLDSDIKFINGVGPKRAELFNKLGIFCVKDLLEYYPRDYQDWSKEMTVKDAANGENCCIKATLVSTVSEVNVRRGMTLFKCNFSDGDTIIHVTIFNNKYLAKALEINEEYVLYGKVEKGISYANMSSPKIEKVENNVGIHPIYRATSTLTSAAISKVVRTALETLGEIEDTLSDDLLDKYKLSTLDYSIRQIHFPSDFESLRDARYRLVFEELLILQLGLTKLKSNKKEETSYIITNDYTNEFVSLLPFTPTGAQSKAIKDCIEDFKSGSPMNRLVQGDVGSGKTAVAAGVIYTAAKNGYQSAMMAPTEILATQHFETLSKLLENTNIRICLLTGSTGAKEKREIKRALMEGEIDLAIGTHALIQNDVEFKDLALIITDEQHRFGVKQRAALAMKGEDVHTLVMSATPIPRTLALMIYGDLDISILNELPPGRQTIRTDVVDSSYHNRIYTFIDKAIQNGQQAYIVCPLVEDSENEATSNLTAATAYVEEIKETILGKYDIGLLHGKMKPKDKDEVMKSFSSGDTKILVSTTVIEVGVDVPNATIMVIENAERFGLSQLHQLRGRVGRGKVKSYCILISDSNSSISKERLQIMKMYSDGFKIADEDLKQRGPGDFFGNRQHGLPDLKIADMVNDLDTLKLCRSCADMILEKDFNLDKKENKKIANKISDMFRNSVAN